MTEEKIDKLIELLSQRRDLQREIDALTLVFQKNSKLLRYKITDNKSDENCPFIHIIKDQFGYIDEALHKTFAKYKQELAEVQKIINEL